MDNDLIVNIPKSLKQASLTEGLFLEELLPKINELYGIIKYDKNIGVYTREKYELIVSIALLADEIFAIDDNEKEFKDLLLSSRNNHNYEKKLQLFHILRNYFAHFPIFHSWNEAYLSEELLLWNTSHSKILDYFNQNYGKIISFTIYTKDGDIYSKSHYVRFVIPTINDGRTIFLRDLMSFEDLLWVFSLIGYFLEAKEFRISPNQKYRGLISA